MTATPGPSKNPPPALPARQSHSDVHEETQDGDFAFDAPPSYESVAQDKMQSNPSWARHDPRSSSQQSLVPSEPQSSDLDQRQGRKRRLLLIYIHGFMGNETSFRSFPAHVHNLLSVLLADSHVVHSKIYPRYRSKRNIRVARDDFSAWLSPHEDGNTDVVLLGHSMGGLLAAEIVLMPPGPAANRAFRHRILGTINLDVPFLGLHPGIVKSGLASIFKPAEDTHRDQWEAEAQDHQDPNYNPAYNNDVVLPVRKGWQNAWHFVSKHSANLSKATKQLGTSYMEFGGAMANMNELKTRYARVRSLEETNEAVRKSVVDGTYVPRVRFINYYTASHGRPKPPPKQINADHAGSEEDVKAQSEDAMAEPAAATARSDPGLPPLPELPTAPAPLDVSYIQDKDTKKLVEKEHAKAVKAYEKAFKEREKIIADRARLEEKRKQKEEDAEKKQAKLAQKPESEMSHSEKEELRLERERLRMEAEGRRLRGEPEPDPEPQSEQTSSASIKTDSSHVSAAASVDDLSASASALSLSQTTSKQSAASSRRPSAHTASSEKKDKEKDKGPPKDRKFCNLPPKDANGQRDPCWVRIFMEGVDEVGAHCGLFFIDERYERMVGEVSETIERWVHEACDDAATEAQRTEKR